MPRLTSGPGLHALLALSLVPLLGGCAAAGLATGAGLYAAGVNPMEWFYGVDTQEVSFGELCTSLEESYSGPSSMRIGVRVDSVHASNADSLDESRDLEATVSFVNIGNQTERYPRSFLTWFYAVDDADRRIQARTSPVEQAAQQGPPRLEPGEAESQTLAFPVDGTVDQFVMAIPTQEPGEADLCRFERSSFR